ncbi:MAG: sigma-70 family RNA polymerase sigma factor [Anderseniella sp.]
MVRAGQLRRRNSPLSDRDNIQQLLGRIALKDRAAFRELYSLTSPKLFGICLRLLKDRGESEDALQEVYVKIWHGAGSFSQRGLSPISWLAAVTRNHAIDILRARKPQADELDEGKDVEAPDMSPEKAAVLASEGRRIDECMGELDPQHAHAVRQAYVEGYSYEELAQQLDAPLNTVRTWLRRSLIKLRDCLER